MRSSTTTVADLRGDLGLDAGYLSRIPTRFEADDLAVRIYQREGFVLVDERPRRLFGREVVGRDRECRFQGE